MIVNFNDEILIPNGNVGDFAVVACDQFSARPEYWQERARELKPYSALDLILPECFLNESDARINNIKQASRYMLEHDRFRAYNGAVYVTRTTPFGRTRHGIVASIDLSDYDYKPGVKTLIRASERTIEERIPPRVVIREAIDIELPHILLLVDDRDDVLMKCARSAQKTEVYSADLGGEGGHITGELIRDTEPLENAVRDIISSSEQKFGEKLFALVGDGNHSLATAKYCSVNNPTLLNGRALVEIMNIYDEGLVFEPIHRLVKTSDPVMFMDSLKSAVRGNAKTTVYAPNPIEINVPEDKIEAITAIDKFCETFVKHFGGYIEYVHDTDSLKREGHFGIEMRGIQKSELFGYVLKNGVLPKKTFSLGEAQEKRYYIEARRIK